MPTADDFIQAAIQNGYSRQQAEDYIRSQQTKSPLRLVGMAGSEALSGLESVPTFLGNVANAAEHLMNPLLPRPLPEIPNLGRAVQGVTDRMGLTNNLALQPGYGSFPETERLLAAGARGVGAAIPALALGNAPAAVTLGLGGALPGVTGELAHEAAPGVPWIPPAVGMATGLFGGGAASMLRPTPSRAATFDKIASDLGASNATILSAGNELQEALKDKLALARGGRYAGDVPVKDINRLLNLRPDQAANSVLKDPVLLPVLRNEDPDVVDQLAGGMLNRSGQQWRNAQPEIKDALLDDPRHQTMMEKAFSGAVKAPGTGEKIGHFVVGGGIGAAASHFGLIPGGDILGSIAGEGMAIGYDALRSHLAARGILEPWIGGPTIAGGLAGQSVMGVPEAPTTGP